jgi:hypothetical protein
MPGQKSNGPWSMTRRAARSAPRFFRISDVADCLEVVQLHAERPLPNARRDVSGRPKG